MADEGAIDELYTLPVDGFIPARTRLAKELKAAGDREGAARIQSLRKPTVAAWAVNQLVRREPEAVDELFDAVGALRTAQEKALRGAGRRELQEAGARRKAAVDRLTDAAGGILDEAGHGAGRASLDAVTNTLLAVATDPEAARLVRSGRLEKELPPPSGFGDAGDLAVVLPMPERRPERKAQRPGGRPATVRSAAEARAEKRAAELAAQAQEAEREATRRREEADRAAAEVRRLRDELAEAERLAARMTREAERAERRAAEARDRAARARP